MTTKYMVETQIRPRGVADPKVLAAMERVPRDRFVPEGYRNLAYSDCPLPICLGQTISQPYMVAAMTELLNLSEDSIVLEIGTGSGYQTAVLAEIAKEVYTVEILETLSREAQQLLTEMGYENIFFKLGDGHMGWQEKGPFDVIIVTAAPEHMPPLLLEQLKPGGRLVIPVGPHSESQELKVVDKGADGKLQTHTVMAVRFVPLTGGKN